MRTGAQREERDAAAPPTRPASPFAAPIAAWLGRYRPLRLAALTRRGAVWEAERGQRSFALKQVRAETPGPIERLEAEYRLGAGLDHPHIATPTDWCADAAGAAIAFDFFDGGDLTGLAGAEPRSWAGPLIGLIDALGYLHDRGLVHRDVKARNVLLDRRRHSRLIDFGSCRPIGSPWTAGGTTGVHARPDRPLRVSPCDDLYALAVLVEEMLRPDPAAPPQTDPARAELADFAAGLRACPDRNDPAEALRALRLVLESVTDRSQSIR